MRCTEWFAGRGADEPPVRVRTPVRTRRTAGLAWRLWCLIWIAAIVVPLACAGCSAPRYLTQEQDDEMRKFCERPGGCVLIPGEQWRAIRQFLERLGINVEDPT
jgi:hypothetical protein